MEDYQEDFANYSYYYDLEYGDVKELRADHSQTETLHIISVVIYIICFIVGLIGNGIVIWVTAFKNKKTVTSVWLLNLAIADFIFVLFLPLYVDYILRDFHWNFGTAMCKINSFASVMNMYASVLFVTVLSVDRYVSLVHLDWSRRYRSLDRAWFTCGVIWLLAAVLSFPTLIFRDTMVLHNKVVCFNNFHAHDSNTAAMRHITIVVIRTTVGFLLPFAAISVTGILLTAKLYQSRGSIQLSYSSKIVTAIILAFFLCWAPFHAFGMMELSMHSSLYLHNVLRTGFPLATSLAFFNSCINPVLYVLLGKKVRRILKQTCLSLTKSSLREINQSISVTEVESVPAVPQDTILEEPAVSSTV
ncbi:chemerin-like receptor 2 [Mugil cephalus]|uniref:chemerin-like receptor 2 n=1 Tax=Mugil cephalus TaxID=48193 RepID=UPI001FB6C156|nr:chemerin-like receptor 2 [Mugil cephalus]XP_047457216.1 chemerin-like receptor 2 [Mugil cephalus]